MAKQETKKTIVDVDLAIEHHNKNNPNDQIDRYILSERIGKKYQDMVNLKNGRVPNFTGVLKHIIEITGVDFNELVTYKKD